MWNNINSQALMSQSNTAVLWNAQEFRKSSAEANKNRSSKLHSCTFVFRDLYFPIKRDDTSAPGFHRVRPFSFQASFGTVVTACFVSLAYMPSVSLIGGFQNRSAGVRDRGRLMRSRYSWRACFSGRSICEGKLIRVLYRSI
jgi:hypothetical protein